MFLCICVFVYLCISVFVYLCVMLACISNKQVAVNPMRRHFTSFDRCLPTDPWEPGNDADADKLIFY